jgi:hypothetical protein
MSDRWRGVCLLIAIFVCGGVAGGAIVQLRTTALLKDLLGGHPASLESRVKLLMLDRGLSLSAEQRERVRPIVEESATRARAVRQRVEPELLPLRQREREAIRALLTSEQQEEYERRLADIDAALGRQPR